MNKETFDDYLKAIHAEDYHGTDDNMPDAFEDWLGTLDGADYIRFADEALQRVKEGKPLNKIPF